MPFITRYTNAGSLYYTDDRFAYTFLPIKGNYVVVVKEKGLSKGLKDRIIERVRRLNGNLIIVMRI